MKAKGEVGDIYENNCNVALSVIFGRKVVSSKVYVFHMLSR
jgi:hypothetical protein